MQPIIGNLTRQLCKRKKKGIQIGKEVIKLSLFADYITLHLQNIKDYIKKSLELTN